MDATAMVLAIVGLVGVIAGFNLNRLVENKIVGSLLQIVGVLIALTIMGALAPDSKTAAQAGSYLFYLVLLTYIVWRIFFRKKAKNADSAE